MSLIYFVTFLIAILYVATVPWKWHGSTRFFVANSSWYFALAVGRMVLAGLYLSALLLYLPKIHFILNVMLFIVAVGAYTLYTLVRA